MINANKRRTIKKYLWENRPGQKESKITIEIIEELKTKADVTQLWAILNGYVAIIK